MEQFDFRLVPELSNGTRWFIRAGAVTKFNRGFRTRADFDSWCVDLHRRGILDWRVGRVFRVRGLNQDLHLVTRKGR